MSDNVTQFPVIPRPLPPKARVIPIRDAADVPASEKDENIALVRRDLDHAIRKATVVAEFHGELAWLVRHLESEIAKLKDISNG